MLSQPGDSQNNTELCCLDKHNVGIDDLCRGRCRYMKVTRKGLKAFGGLGAAVEMNSIFLALSPLQTFAVNNMWHSTLDLRCGCMILKVNTRSSLTSSTETTSSH